MESTEDKGSHLPADLGPYRFLRWIGSGGMGEVFEALDQRLDRRVAVKRLHRRTGLKPGHRQRLRQEARTAASLNHPSLVQIYDILERGDTDFLVLELVEGTSLRQSLTAGPLPKLDLLRLTRELAEGLAHAHQRGVIHRDLKAENVLLTAGGRSKITDFGIAKRQDPESEPLTQAGALVGTYQGMSPEQAQGQEIDHRSDLFSFGLLLYEAATGSNPFLDENPLATLRRIVRDPAPPLGPQRPDLPAAYVDLIHRLLDKQRELRPQSASEILRILEPLRPLETDAATRIDGPNPSLLDTDFQETRLPSHSQLPAPHPRRAGAFFRAVALVLSIAGGLLWILLNPTDVPNDSISVAVPMPRSQGYGSLDRDTADLLPSAVRYALVQGLLTLQGVSVLARQEVDSAGEQPAAISRITGADEILDSEIECRGTRCWISLERISEAGQRTVWTERLEAPGDDVFLLSQAVLSFLKSGYPDLPGRDTGPVLEVRPRDYETFLRLQRGFLERSSTLDESQLLERLERLRQSSPNFLEGYLLAAEVLRLRFIRSREPDSLQQAFELLAQARRRAPNHPRPLHYLFPTALAGGRLEEAEEALAELSRMDPGADDNSLLRAHLLEAQGKEHQALIQARRAVTLQPSRRNLSNLANLQFKLGDVEACRRSLEEALQLAPQDFTLHSQLAMAELMAGETPRAEKLYRQLVEHHPGFTELSNLGLSLLLLERFGEARDFFHQAWNLAPRNVFAMLNLADAELLAGNTAQAKVFYRKLLEALEKDPAAQGWQFLTVRGQALAHLREFKGAVAAVLEAQRLAPDIAQVAYESSLVYALAGDETSALVQAERALELGYEARWFRFPWFDDLRRDPAFGALAGRSRVKSPAEY